jgi:hypothetical protein
MPARSRVQWLETGPASPHGVTVLKEDGTHARFKVDASTQARPGGGAS